MFEGTITDAPMVCCKKGIANYLRWSEFGGMRDKFERISQPEIVHSNRNVVRGVCVSLSYQHRIRPQGMQTRIQSLYQLNKDMNKSDKSTLRYRCCS